jgi:hypothetical protein
MSRFGLIAYGLFITSVLLMSILIPFGDEPDFEIRIDRLQNEQLSKFDLHHYINFFPKIEQGKNCNYESGSKSIWTKISSECIELNLDVVPYKLLHVLFLTFPIFLLVVFRRQAYQLFFSSRIETFDNWERKVDATILGIFMPSAVYSFSFISQEVFSYSLLFLLLIIYRNRFLVGLLLFWIFNLDFGDFLVASLFLCCRELLMVISKKFGIRLAVWCAVTLVFSTYVMGEELLKHFAELNIQSKFLEVHNSITSKEAYDNYPLLIRPVIAILSLVFMSASGIKSIALYIFWLILTIYLVFRIYCYSISKNNTSIPSGCHNFFSEKKTLPGLIGFLAMIVTIFCIVLIAPTHTNAKYYIFMMPFAIYPLLYFFNRYILLFVILLSSLILYFNIIFYYMS